MFLRSQFNYDTDKVSDETGLYCKDISLTQQHQAKDADINEIVRKFGLTGQLPTNVRAPQYGDFTAVTDYQSALNAVIQAEKSFMELPANVRYRFNNSPQAFLEFCADPANGEEAVKLGIAVKREPAPAPAAPQPEPAPAATAT